MALILNEKNFADEIKEGVTLVDFWAEWCGPCKMMLPILEQVAKEMEWKAKVAKINVDEEPALASQFRIMSIPTLIIFKDGKPVSQLVWVKQAPELVDMINKYLVD